MSSSYIDTSLFWKDLIFIRRHRGRWQNFDFFTGSQCTSFFNSKDWSPQFSKIVVSCSSRTSSLLERYGFCFKCINCGSIPTRSGSFFPSFPTFVVALCASPPSGSEEVIYQTWDAVFHHQMKHREESWKYDAQRSIFDELRGVSSQTKSFLKEKLRMQILSSVSSDFQTLIKH